MAVMLPTIMKNLFSKPETRLYPVEERTLYPNARGHIEFYSDKCSFCTLCAKRCPADAIKVDRANKTLTFQPFRCIVCVACIEGCPKSAIGLVEKWHTPEFTKSIEVHEGPVEEKPAGDN
jgi:ech hydrogenase subunit F